ncbi:uncharacterized protein LOC134750369 [Cydia strobilella]|uniref:uncharacterized protein LOC134750369 n=1 Tax=Cydia strobilella TaxID=1100964 RepID=UPI003006B81F
MAFYNRKMIQNKHIIQAWRAGHRFEIHCDEEINLPDMCDEIGKWTRHSRSRHSRLSVRSLSVVLFGAVRLYRHQTNRLLKDTFKCSTRPVSVFPTDDHTSVSAVSESSVDELAEFMTGIDATNTAESSVDELAEFMTGIDATNTAESSVDELAEFMTGIDATKTAENNIFENGNPSESTEYNTDTESLPEDDDSTVFAVSLPSNSIREEHTHSEEEDTTEKKRDQMIQTSPTPSDNFTNFDQNLPLGYTIVHDNFHSRIPSMVIMSSLPESARFLPSHRTMHCV